MSRRAFGRFLAAGIAAGAGLLSVPVGAQGPLELRVSARKAARIPVLVELTAEPAARIYGRSLEQAAAGRGAALAEARGAVQAHLRAIERAQDGLATALQARFDARVSYRVGRALNAIAVQVEPTRLDEIRQMPGVKAVHVLEIEYPTSSTSVPFLGVPQLWDNALGLGRNLTGAGIRIGIIDTGVDYQHSNLGGTGLLGGYQANDRTTIADGFFPTAKVVGGTDFVGDSYTGTNLPVPDPDPMDCNGHGTHVAGIAAGFGVNADGTTYGGPYDGSVPFGTMRIGPGVAPQALLYALRVFGCTGGTTVTVQAIDWAIDPNGDGDFSDHLDVINMSLGSNYGGPTSTTALASENAALAGVIVVASAGNAGDTYFISGSPGSAAHAVSVAATADGGGPGAVLQVNSPPAIVGNYLAAASVFTPTPPAPAGQTAGVVQALDAANPQGPLTTDACTALTNPATVSGKIALIDRGTCAFNVKVANAQAAGAIGAIVVNNVPGDPNLVAMTGSGIAITIPSIFISQADGNTIKAQLAAGVNATLAAANAGDVLASFSSRGPRLAGSPIALKPDLAAPGLSITSAQTGVTCTSGACQTPDPSGFLPNNQALVLSGTSMAAPHMAGVMALLRQLHPDWTVEELKALAMNTSLSDATVGANGSGLRYGPGRVGAGRTHPTEAATTDVAALNAEDAGLVSISFDGLVLGAVTRTKKIRVANKGTTAATYDLAIDTVVDAPGISFSLPGGSSLTVPAGASVELDVQMDANATQMRHAREATVATFQAAPSPLTGNFPRHWLTEEAGYVTFRQSGVLKKRVPVYVTARPASAMAGAPTIVTGGALSGSTTIPLSGTGVCTGTLSGPTCTGSFPTDEVSLVTPFELQVVSPLDPANAPPYADIQYAGVAWTGSTILFGVSTWGNWSTPTDVAFNIYIDNNSDGIWDRILFNSNPGTMGSALFGNGSATGQDYFVNAAFNIMTSGVTVLGPVNRLSAASFDSALFDNHVMFLAATPAQLGIAGTSFKYKIVTCPGSQPLCAQLSGFQYDSAPGPYSWDRGAQGLNFSGTNLAQDLNGASIPVAWNTANMAANGSPGALLLHHHNLGAGAAQVVLLDSASSADLSITKTDGQTSAVPGLPLTYTIVVSNAGPSNVTGATVTDTMPAALAGVSWTCVASAGSACPASGSGSINASVTLPAGGNVTFTVTATVVANATGTLVNAATVTVPVGVSDPNPGNNSATDTDTLIPTADLSITKTDGQTGAAQGQPLTYRIVVANAGPSSVSGATVTDTMPSALTGASWTCAGTAGSSCGTASGSGNINTTVSLPAGGRVTYTVSATVSPGATGSLVNTATVAAPAGVTDPNPANNSAADTDVICTNPLSSVTILVVGSTVICPTCTGGVATLTDTGGGSATHQWGYRTTSGVGFTPISGAILASYTIDATDFGGTAGVHYLVERTTPSCGAPADSNEVKVILFSSSAGGDVSFLTATSRSGQNGLEWLDPGPPSPYSDTLIRYTAVPGSGSCTPPADPGQGTQLALIAGAPGGKDSFLHSGLANDNTTYCYAVFVHKGSGVFSTGKDITGRPFDATGSSVKWAFNVGMTSIVPPGNGSGQIHAVAQDNTLHSMLKGASGGAWPSLWSPQSMLGPSQGRPSTISLPTPIGGANRLIFLGSQDGRVYAVDAERGNVVWSKLLTTGNVQAAPSGYFTFFGGTRAYILVGTRDTANPNAFYALELTSGNVAWSYDGTPDGLRIGVINGQATVDYASKRVYFASFAFGPLASDNHTLWCLDLETGARAWSVPVANVAGSPIVRGGRLYVASYDVLGGMVHALNATDGSAAWLTPFPTGLDGPVKLFVAADRLSPSGRLLFSTTTKLWALDDPTGSVTPPLLPTWVRDPLLDLLDPILDPSAPVFFAGGLSVYVGSSDGKVYCLDYNTGLTLLSIPLGDPAAPAAVGSPTLDLRGGFLYVGTEAGIVYAVQLP